MFISAQVIFNQFKDKVLSSEYSPETPEETLKARITAAWLMQNSNSSTVNLAEKFLNRTSTYKLADLQRLKELISNIDSWDGLEICSTYTNDFGTFLEYKITYYSKDQKSIKSMHQHANFKVSDQGCTFVAQNEPLIRVIGDPVLHQAGALFPVKPHIEDIKYLRSQIDVAKAVLIKTGGGGIAANQCAGIKDPYRFAIVGIFHDFPEHVAVVSRRYPKVTFPEARVMVNPEIINVSEQTQSFDHACLSVPCANKCEVISPLSLTVSYLDPDNDFKSTQAKFSGMDAVVLWHELKHILFGETYIDVTFGALSRNDLILCHALIDDELKRRPILKNPIPNLTVPPAHVSVYILKPGELHLDTEQLACALTKASNQTLLGLKARASLILEKKLQGGNPPGSVTAFSIFKGGLGNDSDAPESKFQAKL